MLDIHHCHEFYHNQIGMALQNGIRHEILPHLPATPIKNGLILGYGEGFINDKHFDSPPIYAYSDLMGAKNNSKNTENYSCLVKPYQLPFANEQFEFIFSIHFFDQLEAMGDAMGEANRVAMQGGILITIFNNTQGVWVRHGNNPFADNFVYSNQSFCKNLQENGWQVQELTQFGFSPLHLYPERLGRALEKLGKKYMPLLGGLSMVVARKVNLAPKRIKAQYNLLWEPQNELSHATRNHNT